MNVEEAKLARQPHYLLMLKLYIRPDGSLLFTMGNTRMEVTADEVHALLCGTLDYSQVFRKLHEQTDQTTLAILSMSDGMIGNGAM